MKNLVFVFLSVIFWLSFAIKSWAVQTISVPVRMTGDRERSVLTINYQVQCQANAPRNKARMITGEVDAINHKVRFELFEAKQQIKVMLGSVAYHVHSYQITLDNNQHCTLSSFAASTENTAIETGESGCANFSSFIYRQALALGHSPFLVIRTDQIENKHTDLPLKMVYHYLPRPQGKMILFYTAIFSDEDSKTNRAQTDAQMARYGRRTDIEWVYAVEFDRNGRVLSRNYQGAMFNTSTNSMRPGCQLQTDLGHGCFQMRQSSYNLVGTQHPFIFVAADNNIVSDLPNDAQALMNVKTGHFLVADREIENPLAREIVMFEEPWMFKVSDQELQREGKLSWPSPNYVYAVVNGQIRPQDYRPDGAFRANLTLSQSLVGYAVPQVFASGGGHGNIDRFGENMWDRQAITGIQMPHALISDLERGRLRGRVTFEDAGALSYVNQTGLGISDLRFYRLTYQGATYGAQEISNLFTCSLGGSAGFNTVCFF